MFKEAAAFVRRDIAGTTAEVHRGFPGDNTKAPCGAVVSRVKLVVFENAALL
jgi:hypothetical protein